jgi:hypothetical protein
MTRVDRYRRDLDTLIGACIGRRLTSVVYGTIDGECTLADIATGVEWIGGEVLLTFEGREQIVVGWGENDGWNDHFSLAVQSKSTFSQGTLISLEATGTAEWRPLLGEPLLGATCRAGNSTPHALILRFGQSAIVLADGHQGSIGDGDDVVILPFERSDLSEVPETLWSAGAP